MNREEQIRNANPYSGSSDIGFGKMVGFNAGAEWADKKPASPWISVKERMPSDYRDKIIKLTDGSIRLAIYDSDDDGYFWSDNYADESFLPEEVTHWMPMPE